jgi:hypothetical protein
MGCGWTLEKSKALKARPDPKVSPDHKARRGHRVCKGHRGYRENPVSTVPKVR